MNELPKNWLFSKLDIIATGIKGKLPKILNNSNNKYKIPYIDIKAFEKKIYLRYTDGVGCVSCNTDDILVVWDGARCGLVGRGVQGAVGSTLMKIESDVDKSYLFYFLFSKFNLINKNPRGVGIPHVEPNIFWNLPLPLPPLTEQHRIVAKLEELFTKLDTGVEELMKVKLQIKRYRQCVLIIENYKSRISAWEKLFEMAEIIMGQSPPSSTYNNERIGLPFYQGKAEFGVIYPTPVKWCSKPKKIGSESDIILSVRAPVGPVNILKEKSCIGRGLTAIRCNNGLNFKFLFYYLRSIEKGMSNLGTGTTFKAISKSLVENIKIPVLSLNDQINVVSFIERHFSIADEVEKVVDESLKKADRLRQTILKKAFEGELVPQDPNDEPAEKLLERIKEEKNKNAK